MITLRTLSVAALLLLLILIKPNTAAADPDDPTVERVCLKYGCRVQAQRKGSGASRSLHVGTRHGGTESRYREAERRAWADFKRTVAIFEKEKLAYDQCILKGRAICTRPSISGFSRSSFSANGAGGPPVIQISPAQAGAIAVARLQLPAVAPGIGPSPNLNRWKMAAVGYPLWLWADGPTQVGPVWDSVAGLSVSLNARVTSLTFRMGDGKTVECPGAGDKWTNAVEPGTKAPTCGHTYTTPSLPKGNYKVSAVTNWAVTWTANGQSGVINVPAVETTELPVGELQVLVR